MTVGTSAQSTLTISSSGSAALTVSNISYPTAFSGNWSGTIPAVGSQNVIVTFTPTATTSYGGAVTVNSDADSGASTIAASGTGTAPGAWIETSAPNANWTSVASSADGTKLIAAALNGIYWDLFYTSTDSGTTWKQTLAPFYGAGLVSVACSGDGANLVAAAYGGSIYTSADSGATWRQTSAPIMDWVSVASSVDGSKVVASAQGGGIYASTDSGASWTRTAAPSANWTCVASSSDGTKLVACAWIDTIYTSTNSGASWGAASLPPGPGGYPNWDWLSVASSADGSRLLAGAWDGLLYNSTNSGATWAGVIPPTCGNRYLYSWRSLAPSADGTKLVAAAGGYINAGPGPQFNYGPIYRSPDSAESWAETSAPATSSWFSVASSADGNRLVAVSYGGGIYTAQFPTASQPTFQVLPACVNGLQVDVTGATDPESPISCLSWNWGDGQQTAGGFPSVHTYSSAGQYTLSGDRIRQQRVQCFGITDL